MGSKFTFSKILNVLIVLGVLFVIGRYLYMKPKYIQGEVAPNFINYLPSGDSIQLSDFKGQFVLLDFWGSWCPPCRAESPDLVALYKKFHDAKFKDISNFEIISVGIEKSKKRWLAAIKKDNLYWPYHVSELQRLKSKTARLYGVNEIPTKYLINKDGYIISVNPTFEELDKILTKHLEHF